MSPPYQEAASSAGQRPKLGPKGRDSSHPSPVRTDFTPNQPWAQHPSPAYTLSCIALLCWGLAPKEKAQKGCQSGTIHFSSASSAVASLASGQPRLALPMPSPVPSPILSAPGAMKEVTVRAEMKMGSKKKYAPEFSFPCTRGCTFFQHQATTYPIPSEAEVRSK